MLIKHTALATYVKKATASVYFLIGDDPYLMTEAVKQIKTAWSNLHSDTEILYFSIEQTQDWRLIYDEANTQGLFSQHKLIDIQFSKKTLDASSKSMLSAYLDSPCSETLLLIQAPLMTSKLLSFCSQNPQCTLVQISSLNDREMTLWIKEALNSASFSYTADIVALIQQYTSGNHLACAQCIEKLTLVHPKGHTLSLEDVRVHLNFECEYELFELTEACLLGNLEKSIRCFQATTAQKTETTLIIWVLTQEIRLLIQLHQHLKNGIKLNDAANQLKIWNQRIALYQTALNRLSPSTLQKLLEKCQKIDEGFKMGKIKNILLEIETLIVQMHQHPTSL